VKYFVTVNGEEHEVELALRQGSLEVSFDGQGLDVRYDEVDRLGQVGLFIGDRSYAVSIEGDSQAALVTVAGHLYQVELEDERERAARSAERERKGAGGDVKSIMPGVVVKLLTSAGESVASGEPLLILEAMKMQNEIQAPIDGVVTAVHVTEGTAVASGARLVTLAAREDSIRPDSPRPSE